MPSTEHTQRPPEHQQPWCDCAGCLEFRAIHAGHSPELPLRERLAKRATDRAALRRWEDAAAYSGEFTHARAV